MSRMGLRITDQGSSTHTHHPLPTQGKASAISKQQHVGISKCWNQKVRNVNPLGLYL